MKNRNYSETEIKFRRFQKVTKFFLFFLLAVTVVFSVFAIIYFNEWIFLLSIFIGSAFIISVSFVVIKRKKYYIQQLCQERRNIVRTGIFKTVYEEYWRDGFEFNLIYDKLNYMEYINNYIDINIENNNHEFLILIDENFISIIADEETNNPLEFETSLQDMKTIDDVYNCINNFIRAHS